MVKKQEERRKRKKEASCYHKPKFLCNSYGKLSVLSLRGNYVELYSILLLALLDICFNMKVFSSQQNGIVMRYAKCITRLEMKLIVFSPQCKGKNDFQIMLLILLGI